MTYQTPPYATREVTRVAREVLRCRARVLSLSLSLSAPQAQARAPRAPEGRLSRRTIPRSRLIE